MEFVKYISTPVGVLSIVANDNAVIKVAFGKLTDNYKVGDKALLNETALQINSYFAGKLQEFNLPLDDNGTDFQKLAWAELRRIPYGKTVSYSDQAKKLGRAKAVRAVGGANNKNPLVIIVPCHRVVGKNGSLTGFAGGLETKKFLLEHESKYALRLRETSLRT